MVFGVAVFGADAGGGVVAAVGDGAQDVGFARADGEVADVFAARDERRGEGQAGLAARRVFGDGNAGNGGVVGRAGKE